MEEGKKKILIIEDEKEQSKAIAEILKAENFEIKIDNNGKDGMQSCVDFQPDLVLLDLMIPGMTGLEILENINNNPELEHLKIIVLTNIETLGTVAKSLEYDTVDYYVKSNTDLKDIAKAVKAKLNI